ncbi:Bug family tripartite tricarboxylate transporter substrate binding protein [Sabulicella rubraurantiaca]|uniref:Bug family tripartite tricarboxylate transporter substrate binding protein n=1 Tax=Sabulicella rubraurantiaca TaxID=2811429 RepID=UPI001A95CA93|nr:tripartite tricarboxylate transporter substrate binding protein [Sabulicella rubraurantiaca]
MLTRRSLSVALAGFGAARAASAQTPAFPDRPVRLLVGFPPGGTADTIARIIAPPISARLGQPLVIENRGGAAGVLAVEMAARAPADGHTLVLASAGALAVIPHMQASMPYDPFRDLLPVTRTVSTPQLLVAGRQVPAQSVQDLVRLARERPGRLTFGSTGSGSTLHLAGELFKMRAGVDILHVPYRGGAPAVTALLAGEIDMLLVDIPVVMAHVQSGAFRALGLAAEQRIGVLPDVPTIIEAGVPGVIAEGWYAIYAPAGVPAARIATLNRAIVEGLAQDETRRALANLGGVVQASTPQELNEFLRTEHTKWGEVVRASGARMN